MLVWIIILIFLNLFNSLSRLFFSPLNENKLIGIKDEAKAFRDETIDLWMLNAMTPMNDLFTELTFLYLFFHQARMQKRMQGKGMKKSKIKDSRRHSQMHFSDESLFKATIIKNDSKDQKSSNVKPYAFISVNQEIDDIVPDIYSVGF
jgi:hypothetical protein